MAQSWNWLAPRFFVRLASGTANDGTTGRPCLPAVEQLGDRILLSATPAAAVEGQVPPGPALVATLDGLIGQPGTSDSIVGGELGALKIAGQIASDNGLKLDGQDLTMEFLKINDLFHKADTALTLGLFTPDVQQKMMTDLNTEFLKLDDLAIKYGGVVTPTISTDASVENGLLPAVQDIESQALKLDGTLNALGPGSGAPMDTAPVYLLLNFGFENLETSLLKIGDDIAFHKVADAPVEYLKIKLTDIVITTVSDKATPDISQQLDGNVSEINNLLAGLIQPPSDSGSTGDVLT